MGTPQQTPPPAAYSREQHNAAAREAARYCLLPDPRPQPGILSRAWHSLTGLFGERSVDDLPEAQCLRRQIFGKAHGGALPGQEEFNSIVQDARVRACIGAFRYHQVRDFEQDATEYHWRPGLSMSTNCHFRH